VTPLEFVDFCAQLRLLGATEITAGELSAKFAGHARLAPPEPEKPEGPPLTPEQAREAQRQRELGRGPR
jgi:hypothetical protein